MMQFLGRCSRNWVGMFAIIIGLVFYSSLWAANIYVASNGTGDGGTTLTPASLQDALNTANSTSGNHILFLQQGTYDASAVSGFKITVVNNPTEKSITLSGGWTAGYTAQNTDPETTKLDGGTTTRVLDLLVDGGTAPVNFHLEYMTIENGYTLGGSGAGIQSDISTANGGALNLYINGCQIRNNASRWTTGNVGGHGGGLWATGYVEVSNTTFESNSSQYHGGGIIFTYRSPSTPTTVAKVDNCIFLNNYNVGPGAPNGSAIANYIHLTVTNSRFEGQTGSGSPIHTGYSYLSVSNSFFYNNKIDYWGSAIQLWDANGEIKNSVFIQNNAGWNNLDGYGAVSYLNWQGTAEDITITNCTFVGNRSLTAGTGWGGALHNRGANLTIANSIFWDNGPMGLYSESGNTTISFSDIQGGLTSTGFTDGGNNISDNPGFTPGDYHLPAGSLCIDKGSNTAASGIITDIDGEPRIFNGTVDMGADEFVPMTIIGPANGTTFDTCSYFEPPTFEWTLNQSFGKLELQFFTPANPTKPTKVKLKDPAATQLTIPAKTWKKILKLPGLSGGEINWRLVGTNKGQPVVQSDVYTMTISAPEPADKPDISPVTHTATWGNSCGTKFKVTFGSDENFTKKKKLSFTDKDQVNTGDMFSVTLPDKTWASLVKLVEGVVPPRIYFYVESWDIIKRYQKTDVAYIDIDI